MAFSAAVIGVAVAAEQDWIVSWKMPQKASWAGSWWASISNSSQIKSVHLQITRTLPIDYGGHTFVDYGCDGALVLEDVTFVDCSIGTMHRLLIDKRFRVSVERR